MSTPATKRPGSRCAGGIRHTVGRATEEPRGWSCWTPEARAMAISLAIADYLRGTEYIHALERRHEIPRGHLLARLSGGHPAVLALGRAERIRRARVEHADMGRPAAEVSRRWGLAIAEFVFNSP